MQHGGHIAISDKEVEATGRLKAPGTNRFERQNPCAINLSWHIAPLIVQTKKWTKLLNNLSSRNERHKAACRNNVLARVMLGAKLASHVLAFELIAEAQRPC